MGFFDYFNQKIALDLGTSNTKITHKGKIVVDNPSVIALHKITGKTIAVGQEAGLIRSRTNKNVKTIYPFDNGVISNFDAAEKILKSFIKTLSKINDNLFSSSYNMMISIPYGSTEVEKRAVLESAKRLNAKNVFLIQKPIAAAIGGGINILEPKGNLIVDIGGGTTEIAVITMGRIVSGQSLNIGGNVFNNDIISYLREHRNIHIGEETAERIKVTIGATSEDYKIDQEEILVEGRNILTGGLHQISVSKKEVAKSIQTSIKQIKTAILETLTEIAPEISADIYNHGIFLTGGGSLLQGLSEYLSYTTELPVRTGDNPLKTVITGSNIILENLERYKRVLVN